MTTTTTHTAERSIQFALADATELSDGAVIDLWRELELALAGKNGFGGHIAEIYAYRCVPGGVASTQPTQGVTAAKNLTHVLRRFAEHHGCYIGIESQARTFEPFSYNKPLEPFTHRIHIEVSPRDHIRDLIEDDLHALPSMALDRPRILYAVCKVVGISLTTYHDEWQATPSDAPCFSGSLGEMGAFVRGYATAWMRGRSRQRALAAEVHRFIREKLGDKT